MVGLAGKTSVYKGDKKQLFIDEYTNSNGYCDIFGKSPYVFEYSTRHYKFHEIIQKHIETLAQQKLKDLSKCHEILPECYRKVDQDEITPLTRSLYQISEDFSKRYEEFMHNEISKFYNLEYFFQKTPTIRAQLANVIGFNWKPAVHNDIMIGHPPAEINVWVPFTNVDGANSMLLAPLRESIEIVKRFDFDFDLFSEKVQHDDSFSRELSSIMQPIALNYGQGIIFDSRCLHATQKNTTCMSRLSMDVRFISKNALTESKISYIGTGRKKMPFSPGAYYEKSPVNSNA